MTSELTESEKLKIYIDNRILKGREKIKELSNFKDKLTLKQAMEIETFQNLELEFFNKSKNAILLLTLNRALEKKEYLDNLLDEYCCMVNTFASDFPV
jgi:predicted DNA-binding protein with PD1-like motif